MFVFICWLVVCASAVRNTHLKKCLVLQFLFFERCLKVKVYCQVHGIAMAMITCHGHREHKRAHNCLDRTRCSLKCYIFGLFWSIHVHNNTMSIILLFLSLSLSLFDKVEELMMEEVVVLVPLLVVSLL